MILDGGIATELGRRRPDAERRARTRRCGARGRWSTTPDAVRDVHRAYVDAGCDVISTNTWGLTGELDRRARAASRPRCTGWTSPAAASRSGARRSSRPAATGEVGARLQHQRRRRRPGRARELLELLPRAFDDDPPDLVLLETMTLVRDGADVRRRRGARGRPGSRCGSASAAAATACAACSASTGAARRATSSAAPRGASRSSGSGRCSSTACRPTTCPGCSRGCATSPTCRSASIRTSATTRPTAGASTGPSTARSTARWPPRWRAEGAQIIGGCCGTRPEHIAAARERVRDLPPGRRDGTRSPTPPDAPRAAASRPTARPTPAPQPWLDAARPPPVPARDARDRVRARRLRPDPGQLRRLEAPVPARSSARACAASTSAAAPGCSPIQLARNGAEHVHAIDIDRRAVANTLSNAFRNGVADRMTGEAVDLYPWVPRDRYDLVVASLYQMPVDPYDQPNSHRPLDFWGRNLLDHLITLLPAAADRRRHGLRHAALDPRPGAHGRAARRARATPPRVVDFAFFDFHHALQGAQGARSSASKTSPTRTTCSSATRT